MKSLNNMPQIQEALKRIAQRNSIQHDNGTFGQKIRCSLFSVEEQHSKEADEIMKIIISKKFQGMDYTAESLALGKLPTPKGMMVFKLTEPMYVKGSKVINYNGKNISPEIRDCIEIYIPQDIIDMNLVEYEETDEKAIDVQGQEVPVIELDLKRCLIDVKEGLRDAQRPDRWKKSPRAYVTDIPFRSFQIVGNLLRRDDYNKYKAWNMMSDEDLNKANIESTII